MLRFKRIFILALVVYGFGLLSAGVGSGGDDGDGIGGISPVTNIFEGQTLAARNSVSDVCILTCMPEMCIGDAILSGTQIRLTYICPQTSSISIAESTVVVTITDFVTVNPPNTMHATALDGPATSQELITTATIQETSTLYKTLSVYRPRTSTSLSDGSTMSITEHRISTLYITAISSEPSSRRASATYPHIVFSLTVNGTTLDGVSYTGSSARTTGYISTGTGSGTEYATGYLFPRKALALSTLTDAPITVILHSTVTIHETITITRQMSTSMVSLPMDSGTSTQKQSVNPVAPYPGSETQKLGLGTRTSASIVALALALAIFTVLL